MTRRRFTNAEIEQLDAQILAVLAEDFPQSVRHVFYRMTDPRLPVPVDKSEAGYGRVQRRCLELRRSGRIPFAWISDATRQGHHVPAYDNAGAFLEAFAGLYRTQLWTADMPHVEVWCESRSIAGVLRPECERLAVSLYPSGGFSSATLCYEAARYIDRRRRRHAVIIYIGDFDPAGVMIDASIEKELRTHLTTPLTFARVAVNEPQIARFDLPTKPRKATETRRPDIAETVEAEAMPAKILRQIIRDEVESFLPENALAVAKVAEDSEREGLRMIAARLDAGGLGAVL